MKQVAIYCSASNKIDPKYNAAARELVRALHALGYGVVSGGGKRGTMGAITDESVRVLGRHVAVLPRFMRADTVVICSGVLENRYAEVRAAIEAAGLRIETLQTMNDWCCFTAVKGD